MESVESSAPPPPPRRVDEHRCPCHRLLARSASGGVEVKCPRCRRIVDVTVPGPLGGARCECGRLLAQRQASGLRLRCPRCKRDHHVDGDLRWTLLQGER